MQVEQIFTTSNCSLPTKCLSQSSASSMEITANLIEAVMITQP